MLEHEQIRLQDVIHRYDQDYDGYLCNDPTLVRPDHFVVPKLRRTTTETHVAHGAYARCGELLVHGVLQADDGTFLMPFIMVPHVNISENAGMQVKGRILRDILSFNHPLIEKLANRRVAYIRNGDARPQGGDAFCHIMLEHDWQTQMVHIGRTIETTW